MRLIITSKSKNGEQIIVHSHRKGNKNKLKLLKYNLQYLLNNHKNILQVVIILLQSCLQKKIIKSPNLKLLQN